MKKKINKSLIKDFLITWSPFLITIIFFIGGYITKIDVMSKKLDNNFKLTVTLVEKWNKFIMTGIIEKGDLIPVWEYMSSKEYINFLREKILALEKDLEKLYHKKHVLKKEIEPYSVRSIADGKVIFVEKLLGKGYTVKIDYGGGFSVIYGNLSRIFVKVGDFVPRGEVIGIVEEIPENFEENSYVRFEVIKSIGTGIFNKK
jgi:hypothetical protein